MAMKRGNDKRHLKLEADFAMMELGALDVGFRGFWTS